MAKIGYALSAEEHHPNDLVKNARRAEEIGFEFGLISDHFHPWVNAQPHSPLVWSVLGAIAYNTERLSIGTGVTCPIIRTHPAIIAQAAATIGAMMPGRFFLGVGTGENLNEHIIGEGWPAFDVRAAMLEEAIEIIRLLWEGGEKSYYGDFYNLENARIYTLPDQLPPIYVAAAGEKSAEMAARMSDGLINFAPDANVVETFQNEGGSGPKYGKLTVCCAASEKEAIKTAHKIWPNGGLTGELPQELPTPSHFEQACQMVTEDMIAEAVICGNDVQKHLDAIYEYLSAGYDHVYIHQVGFDQEIFFQFYQEKIMPEFMAVSR